MYDIKRVEAEIDEVLNACEDAEINGSRFPGMSYEQGIIDFFRWLIGETDDHPYPEE